MKGSSELYRGLLIPVLRGVLASPVIITGMPEHVHDTRTYGVVANYVEIVHAALLRRFEHELECGPPRLQS